MHLDSPSTSDLVKPRSRGELPHLYKDGCIYFVTFRLWDAIVPLHERLQRTPSQADCDNPEALIDLFDPPLQLGSCLLGRPEIARIIEHSLQFFDKERYELVAWCIMPNHVHVIVAPLSHHLSDILHAWKSFTSHSVNKMLGRSGTLWERESFDHLIRSMRSLDRLITYTEANPVAAGLCPAPEDWPYSSAKRVVQGHSE